MKKQITSIALTAVMVLALVPFGAASAFAATSPSFHIEHELELEDGATLLFSQKPVQVLSGNEYWQGIAYVLPVGTKIAQKLNGELVSLQVFGETGITGKTLTFYGDAATEITLTPDMTNDKNGVRVNGSNGGLTVFLSESPNPLAETPSFDVKFRLASEDFENAHGLLLFSEEPVDTVGFFPRSIESGGYVFPAGTRIAYTENDVLMEIKVSGATPYLNGNWSYDPLSGVAKEIVLTEELGADAQGLIITGSSMGTSSTSTNVNHIWQRVMIEGTAAAGVSESFQKVYAWNTEIYNSKKSDAATLAYYLLPSAKIQSNDERIIELANTIIKTNNSDYENALRIHDWVSYNIWYDVDSFNGITPRRENSALSTLSDKYAVCEGYANLTVALLRATGISAKVVDGLAVLGEDMPNNADAFYNFSKRLDMNLLYELGVNNGWHVWTEAYIDGKWLIMDTTWSSANTYKGGKFSEQGIDMRHFDMTLRELSYTHRIADSPDYSLQNNDAINSISTAAAWAREGISSAITKGFVPADIQNNYASVITRQEFCRMAVRFVEYKTGKTIDAILQEKGLSTDAGAFSDTSDPDILAAYALGITSGTGDGKFSPNGQFTREQAATMLMNTCKALGTDVSNPPTSDFTDLGSASSWAVDGINFVRANGIMSGTSTAGSVFTPKTTYTRQESIVTFDRIK
ncbi:MAG: S-layer homology domain-containing protein [Clostridiales Family XIII bacterium]|jgi:transglutaminase-like putative cysteine protease|nr:S-layer homology domain-containing protein [Clostridiales Family XIII bacterium]